MVVDFYWQFPTNCINFLSVFEHLEFSSGLRGHCVTLHQLLNNFFFPRRCDISNKVVCYAHPEAPLIEDYRAGDMICSECGLVVGDRVIDVGSEWRTFSNEKSGVDPSRVGGPENPLLSGGDLSTMIGPGTGPASFDAFGSKSNSFFFLLFPFFKDFDDKKFQGASIARIWFF